MTIADAAARLAGSPVRGVRAVHGGDLSAVWRLDLADGARLIAKQGALVATEASMLKAMAATGAPVPAVIACEGDLLLMEWIDSDGGPGQTWDELAQVLACLHGAQGGSYGWAEDYAFGKVTIANAPADDWPTFWAERRLLPFIADLPAGLGARIEELARALPDLLPRRPCASLLHGDLWGGNVLSSGTRVAALIDPACYHGDREVDAAMLTLFDHPPTRFFDALDLDAGWRERQPAYRLWPLLVHLRLFGGHYRRGVEACLSELGH